MRPKRRTVAKMGTWDVPGRPSRRPRLSPGLLRRHLHAPGPISTPFSFSADLVFDAPVYTGARFSKKLPGRLLESKKLRQEGPWTPEASPKGPPDLPESSPSPPGASPGRLRSTPGARPERPTRATGHRRPQNAALGPQKAHSGGLRDLILEPPRPFFHIILYVRWLSKCRYGV